MALLQPRSWCLGTAQRHVPSMQAASPLIVTRLQPLTSPPEVHSQGPGGLLNSKACVLGLFLWLRQ